MCLKQSRPREPIDYRLILTFRPLAGLSESRMMMGIECIQIDLWVSVVDVVGPRTQVNVDRICNMFHWAVPHRISGATAAATFTCRTPLSILSRYC